ncbi:BatD family protein [Alkalimarinus sediminis]|uniref:BatD family protein n=1 Tax=Alkalimarinus sediminis TaxID=1632866 RepID=A0A9E8HL03_9ALTE|nr:BatD family protein [Alkalimarinus sediminis]UZW74628.1 BatD family protein [Alkalimarinus sediminis]
MIKQYKITLLTIIGRLLLLFLTVGGALGYAETSGYVGDSSAMASNVQALIDDDKLAIKVWLDPAEEIIVTQQVNLNIEVSTHRWFVGGTQIGKLEIDDAIVLRRDAFAVNSSRRQQGENWAVQLWTITLYPQRAGDFKVPAIQVTVTVSGEDNQPVKGVIHTDELSFSALEPVAVKDKKGWIATTLFEVDDQFDKNIADLNKGDSVQRTVRFKAENIAAMMLPEFTVNKIDGVGVYPKPAAIEDTVNRGEYLAERTEIVNYVIEQSGEYTLPALTYYWWDLNSQALQAVEIPEQTLSTSGLSEDVAGGRQLTEQMFGDMVKKSFPYIAILVLLLLAIGSIVATVRQRNGRQLGENDGPKALQAKFVKACQQQEYFLAVAYLYKWFDYRTLEAGDSVAMESMRQWLKGLGERELEEQFNRLMDVTYSAASNQSEGMVSDHSTENVNFESLLKQLRVQSATNRSFWRFAKPVDLRLN